MNKIAKTLLITSGICGGAGVLLLTVGVLMGARGSRFWDAMSIRSKDVESWNREIFDTESGENTEKMEQDTGKWNITAHSEVQELEVSVGARKVYLEEYDGDGIQVYVEKGDEFVTVEQEGKELQIGMKKSLLRNHRKERTVKILVPTGYEFKEVDVSIGAGAFIMENVKGKKVDMEAGAGTIVAEGLVQAEESSWNVAAGSIVLKELQSEDTEIDCAAGKVRAVFTGTQNEYYLKGDVGAGSLNVGESSWNAFGKNVSLGDKKAAREISVDCAAGSVTVEFTE